MQPDDLSCTWSYHSPILNLSYFYWRAIFFFPSPLFPENQGQQSFAAIKKLKEMKNPQIQENGSLYQVQTLQKLFKREFGILGPRHKQKKVLPPTEITLMYKHDKTVILTAVGSDTKQKNQ